MQITNCNVKEGVS